MTPLRMRQLIISMIFLSLVLITLAKYLSNFGNLNAKHFFAMITVQGKVEDSQENTIFDLRDEIKTEVVSVSGILEEMTSLRDQGDSFLPFGEGEESSKLIVEESNKPTTNNSKSNDPPLKNILLWNEIFGDTTFYFGHGREPFLKGGCQVNTCQTTADKRKFPLEDIDAVVWHVRGKDLSLPSTRSPHTRYVFWSWEAPPNANTDLRQYPSVFNWTMTYRLDSDFPNPYGVFYRRKHHLAIPEEKNYALGKTKMAAWFVSHCTTPVGRETLVTKMQNWINIDVYGGCGKLQCDREKHSVECFLMLERDYKFFLSFENSLCKDYVTEKAFDVMEYNVVPVVYGSANYTLQLPPHSYINVFDFPSVKQLAEYLLYLDRNDSAYNEYFQWKKYHDRGKVNLQSWCQLCERLHYDNETKVYDIHEWFIEDARCLTKENANISKFIN